MHLSFDAVVATFELIDNFVSLTYEQILQPFDIDVSECTIRCVDYLFLLAISRVNFGVISRMKHVWAVLSFSPYY